jgi:hypothetical protein
MVCRSNQAIPNLEDLPSDIVVAAKRCAERMGPDFAGFAVVAWDYSGCYRQCALVNGASLPPDAVAEMVKNAVQNALMQTTQDY